MEGQADTEKDQREAAPAEQGGALDSRPHAPPIQSLPKPRGLKHPSPSCTQSGSVVGGYSR